MGDKQDFLEKTGEFVKNNKVWLIPLVLILISMSFAFFLRAQIHSLPLTDNWAEDSVENFYKNQIRASVDAQFPNLPQQNRDPLVNEQYADFLKQNKDKVENEIIQLSTNYKNYFKNDLGETYLVAIDPYYYLQKVRNVVDHGHPGEILKDGKPFNTLMRAPDGVRTITDFHTEFSAIWHNSISFFNKDVSIMFFFLGSYFIYGFGSYSCFLYW